MKVSPISVLIITLKLALNWLSTYICFFSAMLFHGYAPHSMSECTVIPIPKGSSTNKADSANYQGIALCSIFAKVFDLIFLQQFSQCLITSDLQFGFKPAHSTTMCMMVLKETLAYYTVDGGEAFCTFLDATKAFDRVDYCKLFLELMKRDIHPLYLRLMLYMYTDSNLCVSWDGSCSTTFRAINGVKQGGIVSPFLCVSRQSSTCTK